MPLTAFQFTEAEKTANAMLMFEAGLFRVCGEDRRLYVGIITAYLAYLLSKDYEGLDGKMAAKLVVDVNRAIKAFRKVGEES